MFLFLSNVLTGFICIDRAAGCSYRAILSQASVQIPGKSRELRTRYEACKQININIESAVSQHFIGCGLNHPVFWIKISSVVDSCTENLPNQTKPISNSIRVHDSTTLCVFTQNPGWFNTFPYYFQVRIPIYEFFDTIAVIWNWKKKCLKIIVSTSGLTKV